MYTSHAVLLTRYFVGDKIEKNEMGGACSSDGGRERNILQYKERMLPELVTPCVGTAFKNTLMKES
jgi:hypothetical protein